ncbi:MAG TPA: SdpI family protein [Devosia sp.]|nr:SdpI family protein [Devosia sp.]
MFNLVSRFHLLLLGVLLAITGVAVFRIPADYAFVALWNGGQAEWLWPRDIALAVGPILAVLLIAKFLTLGLLLTKTHLAKIHHILDPALTLMLAVIAAVQLGLLLTGIGSDLDLIRVIGFGLGLVLLVLAVVFAEAERHTYAGLRLPWSIASDRAWRIVHRLTGTAFGLAGAALLALAWFMPDLGPLVIAFAAALLFPVAIAALATALTR